MVNDVMRQVKLRTLWCVLLAAIFPQGGIGVKMLRVSVPQYTLKGESVELICEFDLMGDKLYSVSWYKDHDEFYRYVPKGKPSQHIYRVDGIRVDHLSSDAQRVVIRNVPLRASGMYRCEVSAEAPAFSSVNGEAMMNVVALPKEGPEIEGEERNYQIGDEINLNCTSARSFPAATLQWYVNDKLMGRSNETMIVQQHGLITSISRLHFRVGPEHFRKGRLQVRCVATISTYPSNTTGTSMAPAPAPVLHSPEHHRLSASSPPPALDYSKEALFSVTGTASSARVGATLLLVTSLASLLS